MSEKPPKKLLPRHYWPITFVSMLVVMLVVGILFAMIQWNPYVGMMLGANGFILSEVWILKRKGY